MEATRLPGWVEVLLDSADIGVVVQGADGAIVGHNARACALLALSADELTGRTSLDPRWQAVDIDGRPLVGEDHPAMVALRTGVPRHNDIMGVARPEHRRVWLSITAVPLADPGGVVSLFDEVTDLVVGQALEQSALRIATRLAEMAPGALSDGAGPCLEDVLEASEATTATVWIIDRERGVLEAAQRRVAPGWRFPAEPATSQPLDVVSWLLAHLTSRGPLVIEDPDDVPAVGAAMAAAMRAQGMASAVFTPLLVRNRLEGLLALSFRRRTVVGPRLVDFVALVAGLLGQAYARERVLNELRQLTATLDQRVQERSQALRHEQARTEGLVAALPDLLVELDGADHITSLRVPAAGWEFVRPDALVGRPLAAVLSDELVELAARHLASIRRTARAQTFEFTAAVGGRRRTHEVRLVLVGGAGEVLALVRDVTQEAGQAENLRELSSQLARLTGELMAAAQARDEVLVGVGHELRTPLADVSTLAELLASGEFGVLAEAQIEALATIRARVGHVVRLVDELVELRERTKRTLVEVAPVPLAGVVAAMAERHAPAAREGQLTLQASAPVGGLEVGTDRGLLELVLDNLLENAVQFTDPGGSIGLEVLPPARGEVRLTVWDTGIGIAPEDHPRLFAPFVRLDPDRTRRYDGTGLGLVLVERAVGLLGGRIELDSAPGRGSRFTVVLPCPESPSLHPAWPRGWLGHVLTPARHAAAIAQGHLSRAPEGFVHLSTPHQLAGTIERFFATEPEVVVAVLDPAGWEHEVRWEQGEPGQWFPHAYAEVPWTAVVAVVPWEQLGRELGAHGDPPASG